MNSGASRKNKPRIAGKAGTRRSEHVEASSGNVFADLGLPNPEGLLARAELVRRIAEIIRTRKLTQAKAAFLLGVDQPKVSALLRGRFQGFSSDRLFRFLNVLGSDVEIVVHETRNGNAKAHTRVVVAV